MSGQIRVIFHHGGSKPTIPLTHKPLADNMPDPRLMCLSTLSKLHVHVQGTCMMLKHTDTTDARHKTSGYRAQTTRYMHVKSTKHLCLYFLFPLLFVPYIHDHTIHWISFLSMCHFPVSFSPLPCSAFICQYACLVPCLFVCIAVILPLRKSTRIKPSGHVTMDLYHSSL